jgi:hypothetical protein
MQLFNGDIRTLFLRHSLICSLQPTIVARTHKNSGRNVSAEKGSFANSTALAPIVVKHQSGKWVRIRWLGDSFRAYITERATFQILKNRRERQTKVSQCLGELGFLLRR